MTYRLVLAILLSFSGFVCLGQQGDLFLTHHNLDREGLDNSNSAIAFNGMGQMFVANRSGILAYDGRQWDFIETPSAALSLAFDDQDNLYVGCVDDFGKIEVKDRKYQFVSLDPDKHDEEIYFKTVYFDGNIYFLSEESLLRYNPQLGKTNLLYLDNEEDFFDNLFVIDSAIHVQTNDSLYLFQGDSLTGSHIMAPDSSSFVFFNKHPTRERYVVGTDENKAYIYRKKKFYECKVSEFLEEDGSFIKDGVWLNWRYFALSTYENGCILYDNRNSKIVEIINQSKGLPDNQIQAIGVDKEEGLWISHSYGFSRMEISIPFRSFSNFRGLQGHIYEPYFYKRKLYAATSEGVFLLQKEDTYKSTVYYVEKKTSRTRTAVSKPAPKPQPAQTSSKKKKKKSKKSRRKSTPPPKPTQKATPQKLTKKSYERRVKKELVSSEWVFKKVEGINSKVEQFIEYKGKLFAAGVSGVFEINEDVSELVIHEPIKFIEVEKKSNRLIVGTLYDEIKIYELDGDFWIESDNLNLHGDRVTAAYHDISGRTWFVTPNALLEFKDFSSENLEFNSYRYKNQFADNAKLGYIKKQLYLINSEGYFYLHTGLKEMVEDTILMQEIGKPVKHLKQKKGANNIWVFNGESWYMIHRDGTAEKMDVFSLFPDMTHVAYFGKWHWLVNQSEEILQHDQAISDTLINHNKLFYKNVSNRKGAIKLEDNLIFEHDENSIHLELSRPDYRGTLRPEYQYKLAGLTNEWSAWTDRNYFDFPILLPNKYKLNVRMRDAFGNIEEAESIEFVIKKPYWQTTWFTGLQIFVMAILVITSIIVNRRSKSKYVIVTEGLTILTIVMIIEFLQNFVASNLDIRSTPVVDLGIDVLIALCVFPLEQFLKKVMRAETKGKGLEGKGILDVVGITGNSKAKKEVKKTPAKKKTTKKSTKG